MMQEILSQSFEREQILVGDVYHWELDQNGYFVIQENEPKSVFEGRSAEDFVAFDLDRITENICDE